MSSFSVEIICFTFGKFDHLSVVILISSKLVIVRIILYVRAMSLKVGLSVRAFVSLCHTKG